MTNIYLIRHAEAEGNLYRRIQGQYNSRITELGLKQILALRKRFADIQVHAVYSSDLIRAKTTAQAVSIPRNLEIHTDARLRETDMGAWEDKTWASIQKNDTEQLVLFSRDPAKWTVGESFAAQEKRMREVIFELAAKHAGESICIVSHGNVIRTLLASVLKLPSKRFQEMTHCDNTGVSLLHVENGEIDLAFANDASHLDETTSTFARQKWWKNKNSFDDTNADFLPFDVRTRGAEYLHLRRAAWEEIHGDLNTFSDVYLEHAKTHMQEHPRAIMEVIAGDTQIGLIELATTRGVEEKEGAISFFYLKPEFRKMGFGPQLIGHAVSVYRALGREILTLFVAENNTQAKGFYERFGFRVSGTQMGSQTMLWKMQLDLRVIVREI